MAKEWQKHTNTHKGQLRCKSQEQGALQATLEEMLYLGQWGWQRFECSPCIQSPTLKSTRCEAAVCTCCMMVLTVSLDKERQPQEGDELQG